MLAARMLPFRVSGNVTNQPPLFPSPVHGWKLCWVYGCVPPHAKADEVTSECVWVFTGRLACLQALLLEHFHRWVCVCTITYIYKCWYVYIYFFVATPRAIKPANETWRYLEQQQLQHRRPMNEATAERSKLQQRTANTNTRTKEQMRTHIHTCTTK